MGEVSRWGGSNAVTGIGQCGVLGAGIAGNRYARRRFSHAVDSGNSLAGAATCGLRGIRPIRREAMKKEREKSQLARESRLLAGVGGEFYG